MTTPSIRIASLHVYPIKGCRGSDVTSLTITPTGLIAGDRCAMIVDEESGYFLSQRQLPAMATIAAAIDDERIVLSAPAQPTLTLRRPGPGTALRVTVWDDTLDADDAGDAAADWLSATLGVRVRLALLRSPSGRTIDPFWTGEPAAETSFADLAPALVTSVTSLGELNRRRGETGLAPVPMSRFRPNIVIDGLGAFAEDEVEALHTLDGGVELRLFKPCARCQVTQIDQATGVPMEDGVLQTLATFRIRTNAAGGRGVMFGWNATLRSNGGQSLNVGDALCVTPRQ